MLLASRCLTGKVVVAAMNPLTFQVSYELELELAEELTDVASEQNVDGITFIVLSQTSAILIYTFDGNEFKYLQVKVNCMQFDFELAVDKNLFQKLKADKVVAIDMILAKHETGKTLFLAVASYGIEANSTIWCMGADKTFHSLKEVVTIGAADVVFTTEKDFLYLTFAQVQ